MAKEKGNLKMAKDNREYPCPKCETGELYDANAGGMFGSIIKCTNPDCNYGDNSDLIGCISGDTID